MRDFSRNDVSLIIQDKTHFSFLPFSKVGNLRFMVLLDIYKPSFKYAEEISDVNECNRIITAVVNTIYHQVVPKGRFYTTDSKTETNQVWKSLNKKDAEEIVCLGLRGCIEECTQSTPRKHKKKISSAKIIAAKRAREAKAAKAAIAKRKVNLSDRRFDLRFHALNLSSGNNSSNDTLPDLQTEDEEHMRKMIVPSLRDTQMKTSDLHDHDVLFGPGDEGIIESNNFGITCFCLMVSSNRQQYCESDWKTKATIVQIIIETMNNFTPPCRFLMKDINVDTWNKIDLATMYSLIHKSFM